MPQIIVKSVRYRSTYTGLSTHYSFGQDQIIPFLSKWYIVYILYWLTWFSVFTLRNYVINSKSFLNQSCGSQNESMRCVFLITLTYDYGGKFIPRTTEATRWPVAPTKSHNLPPVIWPHDWCHRHSSCFDDWLFWVSTEWSGTVWLTPISTEINQLWAYLAWVWHNPSYFLSSQFRQRDWQRMRVRVIRWDDLGRSLSSFQFFTIHVVGVS